MPEPILTPADLLRMPDGERHLELIGNRVRLREKGARSSYVSGQVQFAVHDYAHDRGHWAFGWSLGYNCFPHDPNEVRHASVTLVTATRMPPELRDTDSAFMPIPPDFVADSVPSTYPRADEAADADAWLSAGARVFWAVDAADRCVRVYHPGGAVVVHGPDDTLTAPDVLPGFSCPVAAFFDIPPGP